MTIPDDQIVRGNSLVPSSLHSVHSSQGGYPHYESGGYAGSEASSPSARGMRLRVRNSFIEAACEDDAEAPASPRALSDPGSISSAGDSYFAKERAYVAGLAGQVTKHSGRHSNSKDGIHSNRHSERGSAMRSERSWTSAGSNVDTAERKAGVVDDCSDGASVGLCDRSPDVSSKLYTPGQPATSSSSKMAAHRFSRPPASSHSSGVSIPEMRMRPMEHTDESERVQMNQDELRSLVHKKTAEINQVLSGQRLSTALTSISEIPEQVGEALQSSAAHWLDDMKEPVQQARELLANREHAGNHGHEETSAEEKAALSISVIPDMIMASFESSFAKAMTTVRTRVDDVIQGLEGSGMAKEQVVKQMWSIPEEVRQITRDAVKEASLESRKQVEQHLDKELQSFSVEDTPDALWHAKRQIVATVPKKLPDTVRNVMTATESNVCEAVKAVQAKDDFSGVVANRVVADTLLRAKVGPRLGQELGQEFEPGEEGLMTLRICNPGSIGHPELCERACLYFPLGKCTNGKNCEFCHAPHTKRGTHLDKRHREMLRNMNFSERFRFIHPILKLKLQTLGVRGDEAAEVLDLLAASAESAAPLKDAAQKDRRHSRETRTLHVALKFMSTRTLITLLHHAPMPEGSPEHAALELLLQKVKQWKPNAQQLAERSRGESPHSNRTRTGSPGSQW